MLLRRILLPTVLLLAASFARAQEGQPPAAEPKAEAPDPNALFTDALVHLKRTDDLVVEAKVRQKRSEANPFGGAMGGGMVVRQVIGGAGGDSAPPFEGAVELWRDADGEVVILSKKDLPGFRMYIGLDRTVKRTTYEENDRSSLDQLESELAVMLDPGRFVRHLSSAALKPEADGETGDVTFQGKLSRKLVRTARGGGVDMMGAMRSKVLRIEAKVVVSRRGRFKTAEIRVVRNDPMAEMMRRGGGVRIIGPGGAPAKPPPDEEGGKREPIEGPSTVYTLRFGDNVPSERARLFKTGIRKLIEKEAD